uniref:Uncharacterized protein n=1 Tax=Anguilla anguilla TaxID=7936 RepID=A0A0E9PD90_ANGAN
MKAYLSNQSVECFIKGICVGFLMVPSSYSLNSATAPFVHLFS